MEKKKKTGIIIGISFLLLTIFVVAYFIVSYKSDQNEAKKRMQEVEELYVEFKDDVISFNNTRDKVYESALSDMFLTTLKEKDKENKTLFDAYLKALETLDFDYENLKDKCVDVLYPDVKINNKCEAFILGYEEATNIFVNDVSQYNKNIAAYNTWIKEEGKEELPLEIIKTKKDYIDINGDRDYRGKEETTGVKKDE